MGVHTQVGTLLDVAELLYVMVSTQIAHGAKTKQGWDGEGECGASNLGDANDRLVHGVLWDADQTKDVVKMLCLQSATHMDRPR